jgi:hypothetical protein
VSSVPHDLDRALAALAPQVEFPPTPDVAAAVVTRLQRTEAERPARARRLVPVLAAAAVLALALVLLASPSARRAVADWLGIGGVRITTEGGSPGPIGDDLGLGERASLEQAGERAGFVLRFPAALGSPREVYVASATGFEQVAAVYGSEEVPELRDDERLLFVQFRGSPDEAYFKKLIEVEPGLDPVSVNGAFGYWLGGVHEITYRGPDGTLHTDATRLAGRTLLWEVDGITYRLEGELSKATALRIAETLE